MDQAGIMKTRSILVVEDDPIIGILLIELLTSMGHEVCALKTTEEDAVAAAAEYGRDLLLVDVMLGCGSGIAAVAKIRRTTDIPYVYMTGAVIPTARPEDIVLYKPFEETDLAQAIERVSAPGAAG